MVPEDMKAFATRLKESAGAVGIYSPRELARILGIQSQTVNQWYGGKTKPIGNNLKKLLSLLNVKKEWLIHGTTVKVVEGLDDPVVDFADAVAVLLGMGKLLSGRKQDLASGDAEKFGRIITRSVKNADEAFQSLLLMYQNKGK